MDIAGLSSAMALSKTQFEVGVAMLSKTLTANETAGEDMVKMMERSVNPSIGGNIDVSV